MSCPVFLCRLRVLLEVSASTDRLRTWGTGCPCHEKELLEGRKVDCLVKGSSQQRWWTQVDDWLKMVPVSRGLPEEWGPQITGLYSGHRALPAATVADQAELAHEAGPSACAHGRLT
jgi:hypothetical protein